MLFFFADIDEEMLWELGNPQDATRVLFAPTPGPERAEPQDLPEVGHEFQSSVGYFSSGIRTFPAAPLQAFVIDTFEGSGFAWAERVEADRRTIASIEQATGTPVPEFDASTPGRQIEQPAAIYKFGKELNYHICRHQMLCASDVQNAAREAREAGYILLLQIDSDWGVHKAFQFCDMGMVQFWIRPEDLQTGRFDRAWATTEGG